MGESVNAGAVDLGEVLSFARCGMSGAVIDAANLRAHGVTTLGCLEQAATELQARLERIVEAVGAWRNPPKKLRKKGWTGPSTREVRRLLEIAREAVRFLHRARHFRAELGEVTTERRARLDLERIEAAIVREALIGRLTTGALPPGAVGNALNLPEPDRARVLEVLTSAPATKARFAELEDTSMPELEPVPDEDARALLREIAATFEEVDHVARLAAAGRVVDAGVLVHAREGVADQARR